MVTFIPPYCGEEIKSNAEKKMYGVLQNLELKNAYVLHSLGLPRHQTKIYGEIDFVVVCEQGVICLEIKGGRVECKNGQWYFKDRYGKERLKPEGPFAQVTGNMFSLRDVLKQRFPKNPHVKNLLMGSGVVFPDIEFNSVGQEIIPEIIYDRKTNDITKYMNQVFTYWKSRGHREPEKLSPSDIREIVQYLRGEFHFLPTLGSRLDSVDSRLVRLTSEQSMVMEALSANEHLLVEGNAGTGKTLLAVDFARRRAEDGQKVLYLTYNKNLSGSIGEKLSNLKNLKVINIHALFGAYVPVNIGKMKANASRYFSEELPEEFYQFIRELDEETLKEMRYDHLVMDEGQDILKPNYMYPLDCLLNGGFGKGRWAVFYDEKQNIYNPEFSEGMELLLSYHCTKFRLCVNCRNTVQIGTFSAKESGQKTGEFIRENGEEVQKISYRDEADFKAKIQKILKSLRQENVSMEDVMFLAPKKYQNTMLSRIGVVVREWGSQNREPEIPGYATIQGFKGLDSKVVVLFDVEEIKSESYSRFIYIATTRARTLLYIVGSEEFWERH